MTGAAARGPRSGRTRGFHATDALVAVLVAGILYASLARPGGFDCRGFAARVLRESTGISGSDLIGNLFAYALLGAALGFAWTQRRAGPGTRGRAALPPDATAAVAWRAGLAALAACTVLSLSMEALQACLPSRQSSYGDVLANAGGGALGWLAARVAHPVWSTLVHAGERGGRLDGRLAAVVALAVAAWFVAETAPWVPVFDPWAVGQQVKASLAALMTGRLDPWRLAARTGQWLALGLAMGLPMRRPALAVLPLAALAAAALGLRLLVPGAAPPSPETLVTLPVALAATALVPFAGRRACAAIALAGTALAMLAYQLEPGYGPVQPFRWQLALLQGNPIVGIALACWFGWFATTVVAAGRTLGGRTIAWAALPPLLLALTEWAQTQLPGRTPDPSPPLVAIACGALAAVLLSGHVRERDRRG